MNKLLTISIAAYNMENYLDKAIESCVSSNGIRNKIEVIIVNDGSKDDTLKIAMNYQMKYPDCIKVIDKINGGYGSTVNKSIQAASGKYFKLLDADDWFAAEEFKDFLDKLEDSNSDIVFSDYNTVTEEGNIESTVSFDLETGVLYQISEKQLKIRDYAMHAITVKTNLLKESNVNLCEKCFFTDTEFVFDSFMVSKTFSYIDKNVYQYRLGRNGQSVSKQGMINHVNDAVRVAEKLLSECDEYNKALIAIASRSIIFAYQALILSGNEGYKRFVSLDKEIRKKNNILYLEIGNSKDVRLMRFFHYQLKYLWIIRLYLLIK